MKLAYSPCSISSKYDRYIDFKKKYVDVIPATYDLHKSKSIYHGVMFYELAYAHECMKVNYELDIIDIKKSNLILSALRSNNKNQLLQFNNDLNVLNEYKNDLKMARNVYATYNKNIPDSAETQDNVVYVNRWFENTLYNINSNLTSEVVSEYLYNRHVIENLVDIISYIPDEQHKTFINQVEALFEVEFENNL